MAGGREELGFPAAFYRNDDDDCVDARPVLIVLALPLFLSREDFRSDHKDAPSASPSISLIGGNKIRIPTCLAPSTVKNESKQQTSHQPCLRHNGPRRDGKMERRVYTF
mmetsp:Transcript_22560/g.50047  ORF Transcript_22560/g.50047 Transcript_22560/m.50047 type:complete len:109 (+) Transcript_22560:296-622(+)